MAKSKAPKRLILLLTPEQTYVMFLRLIDGLPWYTSATGDKAKLARVSTAVAKHESGFNYNALNPDGVAAGLMQIRTSTQKLIEQNILHVPIDKARSKIFDPAYNGFLGAALLAHEFLGAGKDWGKAIRVYNQGPKGASNSAAKSYLASVNRNLASIPFAQFDQNLALAYGG